MCLPETTTQSIITSSITKEGIKSSIITSEHEHLCTVMLVPTHHTAERLGLFGIQVQIREAHEQKLR